VLIFLLLISPSIVVVVSTTELSFWALFLLPLLVLVSMSACFLWARRHSRHLSSSTAPTQPGSAASTTSSPRSCARAVPPADLLPSRPHA